MTDCFEDSRKLWQKKFSVLALEYEVGRALETYFSEFRGYYSTVFDSDKGVSSFDVYLQYLDEAVAEELREKIARLIESWSRVRPTEEGGSAVERLEAFVERFEGSSKDAVDAWQDHIQEQGENLRSVNERDQLLQRLKELVDEFDGDLSQVSQGIPKGMGVLCALSDTYDYVRDRMNFEAMVVVSDWVTEATIEQVVSNWKEEWRAAIERRKRDETAYRLYGEPKVFWEAPHVLESAIDVARYRLIETFQLGEFAETQQGVETKYTPKAISSLDLWFLSRSPSLCARTRQTIEVVLDRICEEDWIGNVEQWGGPLISNDAELLPDYQTIALNSCCVLKLSRKDEQREKARDAVRWLAREQQADGAWFDWHVPREGEKFKRKHLLTNLVAAEAIKVSGLEGLERTLRAVEDWLLGQQQPDGTWEEERVSRISDELGYIGKTVLVVDYFENTFPRYELNNYLDVARDFLSRSKEFAAEDNRNSRRLAILTAFQGTEALLYGCLSDEAVGTSVYDARENRTIGVKAAIRKLQQHFEQDGILEPGENIEYKGHIDRLKHLRDEIVHKAQVVGEKDVKELTDAAGRLADLCCQRIFGHPLL